MRTTVSITLAVAIAAGLGSTGGCVTMEEHQKVLAANRRANEELVACKGKLEQALADNEQLGQRLSEVEPIIQAKDGQIETLRKETELLKSSMQQLQDRIAELGRLDQPPPAVALPPLVHQALQKFAADNAGILDYLPAYGMVKFKADLTFEKGSDVVLASASEALGRFVDILNGEAAGRFNVYVAGHTDDIPISKPETRKRHPNNWYLSVHRAVSVQKVLTNAGLSARRIAVMGYGEHHPVAPNAPANGGNRLNRRVEIWIVPPDLFLTGGDAAAPPPEEEK